MPALTLLILLLPASTHAAVVAVSVPGTASPVISISLGETDSQPLSPAPRLDGPAPDGPVPLVLTAAEALLPAEQMKAAAEQSEEQERKFQKVRAFMGEKLGDIPPAGKELPLGIDSVLSRLFENGIKARVERSLAPKGVTPYYADAYILHIPRMGRLVAKLAGGALGSSDLPDMARTELARDLSTLQAPEPPLGMARILGAIRTVKEGEEASQALAVFMEYIPGDSLVGAVEKGLLPPDEALRLVRYQFRHMAARYWKTWDSNNSNFRFFAGKLRLIDPAAFIQLEETPDNKKLIRYDEKRWSIVRDVKKAAPPR